MDGNLAMLQKTRQANAVRRKLDFHLQSLLSYYNFHVYNCLPSRGRVGGGWDIMVMGVLCNLVHCLDFFLRQPKAKCANGKLIIKANPFKSKHDRRRFIQWGVWFVHRICHLQVHTGIRNGLDVRPTNTIEITVQLMN